MFLWLSSALFICILTTVSCQECTDNAIRLIGGSSQLEGRVEICRNDKWGTVCDDHWDQNDASVVCRQLGFSPEGAVAYSSAYFGPGSDSIFLDNVHCSGREQQLIVCPRNSVGNHNCNHNEDAGVRCEGMVMLADVNITDVSVLVSWQSNPVATKHNVIITQIVNNTRSGVITEVPGSVTVSVYEELLPEQNYTVCVIGYFSQQRAIPSCREFRTLPQIVLTTQSGLTFSPSSSLVPITHTITATSDNSTLVWIFGSIIALLVFLLIVAGVGLAYPRCIRHRVKDKKYLSNISQFLDRTMYVSRNEAYIERSQQLTANQGTSQSANDIYVPSAYETISDPPTAQPTPGEPRHGPSTSQVTADIVAQHYEMFESRPLENLTLEAAYEMLEQVATGGGENDHQIDDEYSHLQY